jgi:sugar O-acyltransferase (sialic acid O-acetyltransferase NeuD family)
MMAREIIVPREGVNDDTVFVSWRVENGDLVTAGQVLAVIETTKVAFEITAEVPGYITLYAENCTDAAVGDVIAVITQDRSVPSSVLKVADVKKSVADQQVITKKAQALAERHGIDVSRMTIQGIIREKDILALVGSSNASSVPARENALLIYGGGGLARIIIDIVRQAGIFSIKGIIDAKYPLMEAVMDVPVIGNDASLDTFLDDGIVSIVNAMGVLSIAAGRQAFFENLCKKGFMFPNIIHPRAVLEPSVALGQGNLICAGAIIGSKVRIGSNCIVNAGSVISHDSTIADGCHIASGAILAGRVSVGKNTLIGQGCTLYQGIRIGRDVTVFNGVNLFRSVPDGSIVRQ